jgi:hypothetical protein
MLVALMGPGPARSEVVYVLVEGAVTDSEIPFVLPGSPYSNVLELETTTLAIPDPVAPDFRFELPGEGTLDATGSDFGYDVDVVTTRGDVEWVMHTESFVSFPFVPPTFLEFILLGSGMTTGQIVPDFTVLDTIGSIARLGAELGGEDCPDVCIAEGSVTSLSFVTAPRVRARGPKTVRLRNTSTGGSGSTRNKTITVGVRVSRASAGVVDAEVTLEGTGGQGFSYSLTQIGSVSVGGGGNLFPFVVPFDVDACDATPTIDQTTGAVDFTATVTLNDIATRSITGRVEMICKP